MPPLETLDRHQKAVLWAFDSVDAFNEPIVEQPVEIDVRWVEKRQESVDSQGTPIAIDATVTVDREIAVGSIMWKGTLDRVPATFTDLKVVAAYNETPDIKNRNVRREVKLTAWNNTLPQTIGTGT